jgi:hypothetical protein
LFDRAVVLPDISRAERAEAAPAPSARHQRADAGHRGPDLVKLAMIRRGRQVDLDDSASASRLAVFKSCWCTIELRVS